MKTEPKTDIEKRPPRPARARRLLISRLALCFFGLFVGLLIAEACLHVAGISHPRTFQRDDDRGVARRPNIQWWQNSEGQAHIQINSAGFRDREREVTKPENTFRIAVLGDSFIDAVQLPMTERVTERLEQELQGSAEFEGQRIEVLNFGLSGYGTAEEFQTARHCVLKYSPDLVVLAFLTGNDLRNNSKRLSSDPGRPYFVYQDGELVLDLSFRNSPGHQQSWWKRMAYLAIDYSRVLQSLYHAKQKRDEQALIRRRLPQEQGPSELAEIGLDTEIYGPPVDEDWVDAWRVTEGILLLLRDEVESHGAKLLIVTLSNAAQVNPDPIELSKFEQELGITDLFYADRRIKAFGAQHELDVLNLAETMQSYAQQNNVYFHGFDNTQLGSGHWNSKGHEFAARFIAERIKQMCPNSRVPAELVEADGIFGD